MTSKEKKLLAQAKPYQSNLEFRAIYIINSKKDYDGFFGKNGYRNIIVIGQTFDDELYRLGQVQQDVLTIQNPYDYRLSFEISKEDDCLHMWVYKPYKIVYDVHSVSTLILNIVKDYGIYDLTIDELIKENKNDK